MREFMTETIKRKRPDFILDPYKSQLDNVQQPIVRYIKNKKSIRDKFTITIKRERPDFIKNPYVSKLNNII